MNQPLSDKQCFAIKDADARINIWQGAVRSGKTFSSLLKFLKLLREGPPGNVMVVGVTRDSIQRNILTELCNFVGAIPPASKSTEMTFLNRKIYFVGANDESAVRRIQGSTLALAYVDEATCIPEPFWNMLLSRLSIKGSQLICTLNPASPLHWLKTKYIDRAHELNMKTWLFTLDDNPSLDPDYVRDLKSEYTGMWYQRFILGQWAVAEGLVFDAFCDDNIVDEPQTNPMFRVIGIDFGMTNPTAAVVVEVNPSQWPQLYVKDIYYYDGKATLRSKTVGEIADELYEWMVPYNPRNVFIDPSATALKAELARKEIPVSNAKNDVLPGIQVVGRFIGDKTLVVDRSCKKLLEELQTYSWDVKAAEKGIDKPVKLNDHILDGLRYAIFSLFPKGELSSMSKDYSIEEVRKRAYGERSSTADLLGFNSGGGYH